MLPQATDQVEIALHHLIEANADLERAKKYMIGYEHPLNPEFTVRCIADINILQERVKVQISYIEQAIIDAN